MWRTLRGDRESAFESDAGLEEGGFVEEPGEQGDAMGGAAWRAEFGKRVGRIGGPVAAGFGNLDEAGPESERRMAGEIGNSEHFVAETGDEEEIDFGKEVSHFFSNFAAESVGLDEVDGREKAGLAEGVGPSVRDLGFEGVDGMVEGDLFEGGGGFGEEDELEGVVGPVG